MRSTVFVFSVNAGRTGVSYAFCRAAWGGATGRVGVAMSTPLPEPEGKRQLSLAR